MLHGKYGNKMNLDFFKGKSVFLTGHTGFKGSWMSQILLMAEANVTGYSLSPPTSPSLFNILNLSNRMNSLIADIRDRETLIRSVQQAKPDIIIHMAAQPLVRDSYTNPVFTYETNVMGTVNILEAVRSSETVKSFLNVTTDKVYLNREWEWGYRENEALDGFDPYSNSKSCSELITHSYKNSFFSNNAVAISTARAGNVIGGGDFAVDRIIPDCVRAAQDNQIILLRNPNSTRPYQHVLEPLFAYLLILQKQYENIAYQGYYNVGPNDVDCITTGELATYFCNYWGDDISWKCMEENGPHEANFLKLDCSKIKYKLGWKTRWNVQQAVEKTVEWNKYYNNTDDMEYYTNKQINDFLEG